MRLKRWSIAVGYWLLAVLATTLVGSIVQTQFNLAQLAALGQPVGLGLRLHTTGLDLLRFAPLSRGALVVPPEHREAIAGFLAQHGIATTA